MMNLYSREGSGKRKQLSFFKKRKLLPFFLLFIALTSAFAEIPLRTSLVLPPDLGRDPTMRIAILQNVDKAKLEFSSPYKVKNPLTGDLLIEGFPQKNVALQASRDGIQLGSQLLRFPALQVISEDRTIRVDGRTYRASLRVMKNEKGKLVVINEIALEEYLKGVLPGEVDHRWHMEALKAQAVAARTFALFQAVKNPNAPFFLTNDVKSQVYGGKTAEHLRTSEAVDATYGEIMTYRGLIISAYFHSSCGGKTTAAESVWPAASLPPLGGVQCGFCTGSKYDSWKAELSYEDIRKKLNDRGFRVGPISRIEITERDRSGRAKWLDIYHSSGVKRMRASDFRLFVGAEKMRSALAKFQNSSGKLFIVGKGWGHGVGLCQWGSKAMAERGFSYENILRFYYPGSQMTRAYSALASEGQENVFSRWMNSIKEMF